MAFLPQERAKAIAEGKTRYYTGRPCKHGHVAERNTSGGSCVVCCSIRQKDKRANNPEWAKAKDKKAYADNRESIIKRVANYRSNNPEKLAETQKKWRESNKHKKAAAQRARDARKRQATPTDLPVEQREAIAFIYKEAARFSEEYGVKLHVDHIMPLKGKDICGLHVPWNLQITTASYNCTKHNNLPELEPHIQNWRTSVLVHESALPWKLKEKPNGN